MTANEILGTLGGESVSSAPVQEPVPTVSMEAQVVYILDDCVKVSVNGVDKYLSHEDFLSIMDKGIGAEREQSMEGVTLPANTFYFARSASRIQMSCYYPGGIRDVNYSGVVRPSVTPNIIVSHALELRDSDWFQTSSWYFCTDLAVGRLPSVFTKSTKAADRIFLLPFTNTYDSGVMCYGDNTMPRRFSGGNLRGLDWYYQYLFASPFNNDLGIYATGARSPEAIGAWYKKLADLAADGGTFPYSCLSGFPQQS